VSGHGRTGVPVREADRIADRVGRKFPDLDDRHPAGGQGAARVVGMGRAGENQAFRTTAEDGGHRFGRLGGGIVRSGEQKLVAVLSQAGAEAVDRGGEGGAGQRGDHRADDAAAPRRQASRRFVGDVAELGDGGADPLPGLLAHLLRRP
jgi:hypothetical protein